MAGPVLAWTSDKCLLACWSLQIQPCLLESRPHASVLRSSCCGSCGNGGNVAIGRRCAECWRGLGWLRQRLHGQCGSPRTESRVACSRVLVKSVHIHIFILSTSNLYSSTPSVSYRPDTETQCREHLFMLICSRSTPRSSMRVIWARLGTDRAELRQIRRIKAEMAMKAAGGYRWAEKAREKEN